MIIQILLSLVIVLVLLLFMFQIIGRYMFNYRVDNTGITIRYFFIPVFRVEFTDISNIQVVDLIDTFKFPLIFSLRFWNKIIVANAVIITKKQKWLFFDKIIITPKATDEFVNSIGSHIS